MATPRKEGDAGKGRPTTEELVLREDWLRQHWQRQSQETEGTYGRLCCSANRSGGRPARDGRTQPTGLDALGLAALN